MEKTLKPSPKNPVQDPEHLGLERLIFFSDAVFAIAITLLALEIRLPALEGDLTNAGLTAALLALWPKYLGYGISFLVIGFVWVGHHRKFRYIRNFDSNLLILNLLLLMAIAFTPFPAAVLSEYGNRTATIFYAFVMALTGLLSTALWLYASHHERLTGANLDAGHRRKETWRTLIMSVVFLLSIGIAFLNDDLAKASWGFIFVISFLLR
jgi:uncharacterized membrane protein